MCIELKPTNRQQIYIPAGFGHTFVSLEDDTHVIIRIDQYFNEGLNREIYYTYPEIYLEISF